ncbi:MAG: hypothetical protein ISN29_00205 [Gammaproteobacteria bacterium AqS3]|nr:hypothetical protein [Gammaproteobacteria bacterium AqS3]
MTEPSNPEVGTPEFSDLDAAFFRMSPTPGQGDCLEFCISDPEQDSLRILDRIRLPLPAGISASAVAEVLKRLHFEGALILFRLDLAGQKACYDPGENRWLSYRGPASLPNPDDERYPYPSDEAEN